MDVAKLILEYVRTLVWPIVVVILIWVLRHQLRHLVASMGDHVKHMTRLKLPVGEAEFDKSAEFVETLNNLAVHYTPRLVAVGAEDDTPAVPAAQSGGLTTASLPPATPPALAEAEEEVTPSPRSRWRHPSRANIVVRVAGNLLHDKAPTMPDVTDLLREEPVHAMSAAYDRLSEYIDDVGRLLDVPEQLYGSPDQVLALVEASTGTPGWGASMQAVRQLRGLLIMGRHSPADELESRRERFLELVRDTAMSISAQLFPLLVAAEDIIQRNPGDAFDDEHSYAPWDEAPERA